jgi:uracil-DNA glycosylase family 4
MDAQKKLRVLRDKWSGCTKCTLAKLRGNADIIFGAGPFDADFLILTEGPTEEDVYDGVLLSGAEGSLVEGMLEKAEIDPVKNVFRTSLVACRPYVILPATDTEAARTQGRSPDKTEIEACWPRLEEIIYLVDPRIIIAMGADPWKTLVDPKHRGTHTKVTTAAGELFDTWIAGRLRQVRYPVLATLSPKQLIANPSSAAHGPISTTIEAFMKASRYVSLLKKEESK